MRLLPKNHYRVFQFFGTLFLYNQNGRPLKPSAVCTHLTSSKLPAHSGEALAAVDGAVVLGNERNSSLGAAIRTRGGVGLAGSAGSRTAGLARLTASLATSGLILETLFSVEFLFASGEHEFLPTVAAYQRLVFVHGWKPPDNFCGLRIG